MNERRKQDAYKHLAAIRQSLDALGKLGLAGTDDLFERKLRRIVGRAHEAMRELGEFLEEAHPHGAPRPAAPPGADLSARLLSSADLAAYRALQRQSLEEAPLAFVQTLDEDARTPDEEVAAWLDRGEVWGVFRRGELVGKLVLEALPHAPFAHTRWLHAVYIHPGARGSGAGEALIAAVSAHARARGVTRLLLWVHSENPPARAFYEKVGFRETGLIPGGIRLRDHCADDILMWARLD